MNYTFIKDYKDNDKMRKSLNELTEKTFRFSFEEWYSNGFWTEKYIPYSLIDGDRVIANVSVNIMDFDFDGVKKNFIQIGTVMTDEAYRGQQLSSFLMKKVIEDYKENSDGIYLFCGDDVVNFYPKFGFVKCKEYQYSKEVNLSDKPNKAERLDLSDNLRWDDFFSTVKNSVTNDRFTMDNPGLIAFWTKLGYSVYYLGEKDAYIIAFVDGENLFLNQIIAKHKVNLEDVISSFGSDIKKVKLGFTPNTKNGYNIEEYHKEDCTLFILGKDLEIIEREKLMFPILSHA